MYPFKDLDLLLFLHYHEKTEVIIVIRLATETNKRDTIVVKLNKFCFCYLCY